jgi:protease-4
MRYPRILAAIRSTPWAALPSTVHAIHAAVIAAAGRDVMPRADMGDAEPMPAPEPAYMISPDGIAVIRVQGIIGKHMSAMETMCGGYDLDALAPALAASAADPRVRERVLFIDSPGGTCTGVPEAFSAVRRSAETKPVFGFCDSQACSAAQWIASACDRFAITTSATVGSIGVYCALVDESAAWAKDGYRLELVKAGTQKAAGIAGAPITADDVAGFQRNVDTIYGMFVADVRTGRGVVDDAALQGQTFMGHSAVDANLADDIVTDLADLLAQIVAAR